MQRTTVLAASLPTVASSCLPERPEDSPSLPHPALQNSLSRWLFTLPCGHAPRPQTGAVRQQHIRDAGRSTRVNIPALSCPEQRLHCFSIVAKKRCSQFHTAKFTSFRRTHLKCSLSACACTHRADGRGSGRQPVSLISSARFLRTLFVCFPPFAVETRISHGCSAG